MCLSVRGCVRECETECTTRECLKCDVNDGILVDGLSEEKRKNNEDFFYFSRFAGRIRLLNLYFMFTCNF